MSSTLANPSHMQNTARPAATTVARPRVAVVCNSVTPYRRFLHERIVAETPEIELWTLCTHDNAYSRWTNAQPAAAIRQVDFGLRQPTNEQTQFRYAWREWRKAGLVINWLKTNTPAAVFCQGCGDVGRLRLLRWCQRHGLPCLLYGDFNIKGDQVARWKRPLKRAVFETAIRAASGLMPCGERGQQLLERYGGGDKPSYRFPFFPDTRLLQDPPAVAVERVTERFGLDPQRRRIVFSARMMPVKRPDLAIRAFAAIADERPNWDLVMVGDGVLREESEQRVPARLKDRVKWTGFLNDSAEMAAVYTQSDLLLLPSDAEPWGVVVVEAAAAGMAIVTTDVVGASPELVKASRNGEIFTVSDLAALTQSLLKATAVDRIDNYRNESLGVFQEWVAACDPVTGFRQVLHDLGLIKPSTAHSD